MEENNAFEVINIDEDEQVITLQKSPKLDSPKSPRSKRKRTHKEMEAEDAEQTTNKNVAVIDLSDEADEDIDLTISKPPSTKRRKLNENMSTLSALSQTPDFSDITFQVGDQQFFGLKAIFAIKSGVFRTMLYPEYGQEIRFIEINNISAEAFKFIRDFFYDLNPELTFENVINVLNASKIYQIEPIRIQCNEFLNKIDNFSDLLTVLKQFGYGLEQELDELLKSNNNLLQENGKEIIESDTFKALPFFMAKKFIESDNLGVSEEDLWNNTKHWLSSNGDELKQIIRFGRMEIEFIFNNVKNCSLLTDNDLCSIYEKKLGLNEQCIFNCDARFEPKPKKKSRRKSSPKKAKKAEKAEKEEMDIDEEEPAKEQQEEEVAAAEPEEEEKPATPKKGGRRGRSKSKSKKASAKKGRSKSRGGRRKKN